MKNSMKITFTINPADINSMKDLIIKTCPSMDQQKVAESLHFNSYYVLIV